MWHWLRGADFCDPEAKRKCLGKQHVLAPELRTREKAFLVAQKMLQHVAARLRKLELWAGGLGAFVEFMSARNAPPFAPWKAEIRISQCRDTFTLQVHLHKLWESCPSTKPLQVGVWLFELTPDSLHTLSLFDDAERQYRLSTVVDALNDRYGQGAVYFANISEVRLAAPTRIPFSSVPDLKAF